MSIISLSEAFEISASALRAAGLSEVNAKIAAEVFVASEVIGVESHGLARVAGYCDHALSGKLDGKARPIVTQPASGLIRVDARSGLAFTAIREGLAAAVPLVRQTGVIAVVITNSHHAGVLGLHLESLAEQGLVGLACANAPAAISPWGGAIPLFGTNPLALAAPMANSPPLIIDSAMTKVARGSILLAARKGEAIPADWALDEAGNPTTDPNAALRSGNMVAIGGAKGAAFALMIEILAAALTGAKFGFEATQFVNVDGPPPGIGQLFLVIEPGVASHGAFASRMSTLAEAILGQRGARLPGARRAAARAKALANGIDVADSIIDDLQRRAGS
jgi:(2R)-3-sulfolactate dehydrogenase (NADP+)